MHTQKCDRLATASLIIGVIGAGLTGFFHYRFMLVTQPDFTSDHFEYWLLLGSALALLLLAGVDLDAGISAMRQIQKSAHKTLSEAMALSGITLGLAELLPAAVLLVILIELFLLRFMPLKAFLEF